MSRAPLAGIVDYEIRETFFGESDTRVRGYSGVSSGTTIAPTPELPPREEFPLSRPSQFMKMFH